MEEYLKKRNYLNHLKQISSIKNGHYKSPIHLTNSRINLPLANLSLNHPSPRTQSKLSRTLTKRTNLTTRNKSTQQIMKTFSIQKENLRLVERIGSITSQINMRKYQKQYLDNQKKTKIHSKLKKPKQFFRFKIFDIKFQERASDPHEVFSLFEIVKHKKKFITKGTIFELRKQQIKTTINEVHLIKIEGVESGLVELTQTCFLAIRRNREEVGNLVIDIV